MEEIMTTQHKEAAQQNAPTAYDLLDVNAQLVARHLAERKPIARNLSTTLKEPTTFGERAADAVARFGGSWAFIGIFMLVLVGWMGINSLYLAQRNAAFDPYPYILLNLGLSMLASIQAPVILMSQNRQSEIDRQRAENDYQVNLKAEMEIAMLHQKMDQLQSRQWEELMTLQKEQARLLELLTCEREGGTVHLKS